MAISRPRTSTKFHAGGKPREELIEQATATVNIFELFSFQLKAEVWLHAGGKRFDGSYSLLGNSTERWREEITFPGYSESQVGNKGVIYVIRNTDYMPYRVFQRRSALGYGSAVLPSTSFFNHDPPGTRKRSPRS